MNILWEKYGKTFSAIIIAIFVTWYCSINLKTVYYGKLEANKPADILVAGTTFQQEFIATRNNLKSVSLCLATYARQNDSKFSFTLSDKTTGDIICSETVDSANVIDNAFRKFSFPEQSDSAGKNYLITLSGIDGNHTNSITAWLAPSEEGTANAIVNNNIIPGYSFYFSASYISLSSYYVFGFISLFFAVLWGFEYLIFRHKKESENPSPKVPAEKKDFDWTMHYFRGFAISAIVIGHIAMFYFQNITDAFFTCDTIYFLFISGYLCQYLAPKNRNTLVYYKKKIQNVIFPYIVCSLATLAFIYVYGSRIALYSEKLTLDVLPTIFIRGIAQTSYWYIPFIIIIFIVSPLLMRLNSKFFISVMLAFGVLNIIFPQRGTLDRLWPDFFYLYTFFTFSYIFGMAYCRYKEQYYKFFRAGFFVFLAGGLLVAVALLWPNLLGLTFVHKSLLMNIQKLLFTACVIVLLSHLKKGIIASALAALGRYSFALYFIHLFFASDYVIIGDYIIAKTGAFSWIFLIMMMFIILFTLLLLVVLLKKSLGRFSRYMIGV